MTRKLIFLAVLLSLFFSCEKEKKIIKFEITSNKEEIADNGYRFTSSTQSFLRGHHWLENISDASLSINEDRIADLNFETRTPSDNYIKIKNLPLEYLVPRLHYSVTETPDDFDLFNLMMAEYSRNGLSFPFGLDNDEITHFETNLIADIPWKLEEDYKFKPNPKFKPIRFSVTNNCLAPGLWELNATDKTGEVYHSWFNFPKDEYFKIIAEVNNLPFEKVIKALDWNDREVKIHLDRLRKNKRKISTKSVSIVDEDISYSSQGSRQKLAKGFVTCEKNGIYVRPEKRSDVLNSKVKMSQFIEPGIYSKKDKMDFDFSVYKHPKNVSIYETTPLTNFNFNKNYNKIRPDNFKYIEVHISLPEQRKLILGNLPLNLMVQQEDYSIHGFGVGILSAGGFAERRRFLIEQGHHPSFCYLAKETSDGLSALNSHGEGLEQVFIRSYPNVKIPYWDITFTSYERITDIVKYRVAIPKELIQIQKQHTKEYITPVYFSYRDDNLR
jgi:hypothetical protein